nr:DUF2877 domain-containing protein [Ardenticatena sp.]
MANQADESRTIQAERAGTPLHRWMQACPPAHVHVVACFDQTLMLEAPRGRPLLAFTTRAYAGPFRMVVSRLPRWHEGEHVALTPEGMVGEGERVAWPVRWWNPHPKPRVLTPDMRESVAADLALAIARFDTPDDPFFEYLEAEWSHILDAIHHYPLHTTEATLSPLVGYGNGLTPSGDDFLQAVLVTLASGDEVDRARFRIVWRAVARHLRATTPLAAHFLREAGAGWGYEPLNALLDAFPAVPFARVEALSAVGASSGLAALWGVLAALSREAPPTPNRVF